MTRVVEQSFLDKNYDLSRYWTAIPLTVTTPACELEMQYSYVLLIATIALSILLLTTLCHAESVGDGCYCHASIFSL